MSTIILTGAGISALSGLPTYRGPNGLYNDAILEHGMTIEEILSVQTQRKYPELTQKYITQIADAFADADANELHDACHQSGALIFTQNIDDLHEAAGSTPYHLHGTVHDPKNPLVLFGGDIQEGIMWAWLDAVFDATTIVVIGTSCQFPYLIQPISEAVTLHSAKLILLDPDDEHPLSSLAYKHERDTNKFVSHLETL